MKCSANCLRISGSVEVVLEGLVLVRGPVVSNPISRNIESIPNYSYDECSPSQLLISSSLRRNAQSPEVLLSGKSRGVSYDSDEVGIRNGSSPSR